MAKMQAVQVPKPGADFELVERDMPEPGPAQPAPTIDVPVEMRGEDIFLQQGERRYRVRGLNKNMSYELLKVNLLVSGRTPRGESAFHVDALDLYSARQRSVFQRLAMAFRLSSACGSSFVGQALVRRGRREPQYGYCVGGSCCGCGRFCDYLGGRIFYPSFRQCIQSLLRGER